MREFVLKNNQRIGVWGYGVVGAALVRFLVLQEKPIALFDTDSTKLFDNFLSKHDIKLFSGSQLPDFFKSCSLIIPSPGIDLAPYANFNNTYLSELDLFYTHWHKPIIAITGSVGKTTITTLLDMLLKKNNIPAAVGGNIGIGSLDLIAQQDAVTCAVLEVSSFQLEHVQWFTPHIAIITNLHPNHLDRHPTMDAYWQAKANICMQQTEDDLVIIDWQLRDRVRNLNLSHEIWYIGDTQPIHQDTLLPHEAYWYQANEDEIKVVRKTDYQTYALPKELFSATLAHNALILFATLTKLTHNNASALNFNCDNLSLAHRREFVGTWKNLTFINDSKATSTIAMQAAVNYYAEKPTYLLLGGLSKGVDRTPALTTLPESVQEIICFGKEADILHKAAQIIGKKSSCHATLESAFTHAILHAKPESTILLSPAGSSFDLYKNYEERGNHFKQLVKELYVQKS